MSFNLHQARLIAAELSDNSGSEEGLVESFAQVCSYLSEYPDAISWRGNNKPNVNTVDGVKILANRYFESYRSSDYPAIPGTVPDDMVSIVLQVAYGYDIQQSEFIKLAHQQSMCAENTVGALLERYLDSKLRNHNWHWCCGDFVKAIDFISKDQNGNLLELQIKNRDNSENSSSSAIRNDTNIQKWFRTYSRTGRTNWENLPTLMRGYELSEASFIAFVRTYLEEEKRKL